MISFLTFAGYYLSSLEFDFLRLGVGNSYVWWLVFLRLGVSFFKLGGL